MTPRELARTGIDGILEGAGMILGGICLIGWALHEWRKGRFRWPQH